MDEVAEFVVVVCISDGSCIVSEEADAAVSIVAVIAKLPETVNKLTLAYQESAVRVDALDGAIHDLLHYLSMFGWIAVVYEKLGTDAADGLRHAIAVSIVGETDRAGVGRQQTIFEVIGISIGTGGRGIAVRIIGIT